MNIYLRMEDIPKSEKKRITLVDLEAGPNDSPQVRLAHPDNAYDHAIDMLRKAYERNIGVTAPLREVSGDGVLCVSDKGDLAWLPTEPVDRTGGA